MARLLSSSTASGRTSTMSPISSCARISATRLRLASNWKPEREARTRSSSYTRTFRKSSEQRRARGAHWMDSDQDTKFTSAPGISFLSFTSEEGCNLDRRDSLKRPEEAPKAAAYGVMSSDGIEQKMPVRNVGLG